MGDLGGMGGDMDMGDLSGGGDDALGGDEEDEKDVSFHPRQKRKKTRCGQLTPDRRICQNLRKLPLHPPPPLHPPKN
jgi:hypothetical protein